MKILKIENGCGLFLGHTSNEWLHIDKIDKNNLLALLNIFLENEAEMDDPSDHVLQNEVHKIVYLSIFEKFKSLSENKLTFKDESERKYLDELNKYALA